MKKKITVLIISCFLILINLSLSPEEPSGEKFARYPRINSQKVKNVILFIGDGMGLVQSSAARIRIHGAMGRLHFVL